jgi:hypothetical protein
MFAKGELCLMFSQLLHIHQSQLMNIFSAHVSIHELLKFSHNLAAEWSANGWVMRQNLEGRDEVGVHVSDSEFLFPES